MIKNYKLLILILLSVLFFSSCESEEGKELIGFFLGFIMFLTGTIVTGIPAIILSAVSINTTNKSVPIIAIVLTSLYGMFLLAEISMFSQGPTGMSNEIVIFPIMTVVIIAMCIMFIVMGFNKRKSGFSSKADNRENVLDNIINSEEDKDLL